MVTPPVCTVPLDVVTEPPWSVKAPVLVSSLTSVESCKDDAAGGQHHRREGQAHAELLELDRDVALLVAAGRHGEFAAGEEFCGLARHRDQVGFGQRVQQTDLLHAP